MLLGRRAFVLASSITILLHLSQSAQGANAYNNNWNQTYSDVQMSSDTQSYISVYHTTTVSTYNGEGSWSQDATVQRNETGTANAGTCSGEMLSVTAAGMEVEPTQNGHSISVNHYTNTYTYNGQRIQTQTAVVNRPAATVGEVTSTQLALQTSSDCGAGQFDVTKVTGLIDANALNDHGQVAGQLSPSMTSDGRAHAAIWDAGQFVDLGIAGCRNAIARCTSNALSLNNQGTAVGDSHITNGSGAPFYNYTASFYSHEAIFSKAGLQPIKTIGWYAGLANGINNGGDIVGSALSTDSTVGSGDYLQHGFALVKDRLVEIGRYGQTSSAVAINDRGVVTGEIHLEGQLRAFRWQNGTLTMLDGLGGGTARGNDIANSQDQIVGFSTTIDGYSRAVTWIDERIVDLGTLPGGATSSANAINERGDIVGTSDNHAVLWRFGRVFDLNDLVAGFFPVQLVEAIDINNRGEILSRASDGTYYLLSPSAHTPGTPMNYDKHNN